MSTTSPTKPKAPSKPRSRWAIVPVIWVGMNFGGWWRLLRKNRFRVPVTRWHTVAAVTFWTLINSLYARWQWVTHGWRLRRTRIEQDPIFVIGHWRTGTTLLHELISLDERHIYPTTYECLVPNHFVRSEWIVARILDLITPRKRNMDNMKLGMGRPQEEEFALANMGLPSPYLTGAFPEEPPQDPEYLTLEGVPPVDLERWKQCYLRFLRDVAHHRGAQKRLVLKNPPNTARISTLLELFPRAKFVHIVRNPYTVFSSTVNLWRRFYDDNRVQRRHYPHLEEHVLDSFERMFTKFDRDQPNIPPGQYCEIRYERLVADPIEEMRRIYDELQLGEFDRLQPKLERYFAEQADYQTNRFTLSDEQREKIHARWGRWIDRWGYEADTGA